MRPRMWQRTGPGSFSAVARILRGRISLHTIFLKRSKIDISRNMNFLSGYFDRSRSDQEGMPISRFVMRHVRVIRGGLFLGVAG